MHLQKNKLKNPLKEVGLGGGGWGALVANKNVGFVLSPPSQLNKSFCHTFITDKKTVTTLKLTTVDLYNLTPVMGLVIYIVP